MKKNLYLLVCALLFGAGAFAQNSNITLRSTMEFPGQTLANICGWTSLTGQEYALLGGSKGLIIVDVTNPDAPAQIVQIPGPDNLWKEIKTYGHYAYITSEGGQGVQIVDLSDLPSANLQYHHYMGDGPIAGQLNTIHALHIDVNKGFLYAFGSNLVGGGAVVLDLNADPYNPTYAGEFSSLQYVHDGFAENDTLYACHIYDGIMSIVDMSDKGAPQVLGTVETPLKFTHNAWLTGDHRAALNTDERSGSYLTSYDVTDPSDIRELDRMQTTPGSGSIVHNVHIRNDWAISSWYTDGLNIVDAHRPINLVETGRFDTWPGSGDGFDGCWGVFPFFPSGTIVASNIENPAKLTVCSPNYRRACYLEGIITDGCSGGPLAGATITIVGGDQLIPEISTAQGIYRTGQVEPGTFKVTIEKAGYVTQTLDVQLATAQVTELNLTLSPMAFSVNGLVVDGGSGQPVPNAKIVLSSSAASYDITADANGQFNLDCVLAGTYSATVGIWGYKISQNITVNANTNATISIVKGYYDDFALDYSWKTASTASSGEWVRDVPIGTTNQGQTVNPGEDASQDGNDRCYITGNGGGNAGSDDVDNGAVTLTTPPMKLAEFNALEISYRYWFFNGGGNGGTPNDNLEVILSNGTSTRTLVTHNISDSQWRLSAITTAETPDFPFTDNMTVAFRASDNDPGHLVEAGVDIFEVTGTTVGTSNIDRSIRLAASPNPARGAFAVAYDFEGRAADARLILTDITGREVLAKNLPANAGSEQIAAGLQPGIYFVRLENDGKRSLPLKVVVE